MKALLPVPRLVLLAACCLVPTAAGADSGGSPRFVPVEIHLDSPHPVAAWQFELRDRNGAMKVAGIERGGIPAFPDAPYYDREAVAAGGADRIIVADYTLADASRLPRGRMRLAILHLMLEGEADFELRLVTATRSDGQAIDASIALRIPEERTR